MHFSRILLLAGSGVAALAAASPQPAHNDFAPVQVGRRLSRKAIQRRHYRHHHHGNNSTGTDSAAPEPTTTDDGSGDCSGDEPAVVTVYTTITQNPGDAQPTDSATDSDINSDTATATVPTATETTPSGGNGASTPGATIVATSAQCGDPNAVPSPAATSGPNGDENWINCGVNGDGWVPPPITFSNLIYRDLAEVVNEGGSPFDACAQYLPMFQEAASNTGIPEIFLASIALQESGCNPSVTGGAGEIGMMQITGEKCPTDGSDCYDAQTNINIGAQYFQTVLNDQCDGNVACTMGAYNGWTPGLTVASANNYAICAQHNNLDYLQNVFNGYLQGVDPASLNMGIYHNTC